MPTMPRRAALIAFAAVGLVAGTLAFAAATTTGTTATCTPSPDVTTTETDQSFTVTCSVPNPPPVTATVTATATVTVTATPTPSATPSSTPTSPSSGPTAVPTRPFIAYSADAWLKQPIGTQPVNAAKTSAMRAYINAHDPHGAPNLQGLGGQGGGGWGVSYAMGTCADPVWKFSATSSGPAQWGSLETTGFHAPDTLGDDLQAAKAAGGTDLPIEVVDRCNGLTVWAGQTSYPAGASNHVLTAGTVYGACEHASNGLDRRATGSNSATCERSRGVIPDTMAIRADQVRYGIDNATDLGQRLEIFWWETDSAAGKISPPMAGFEGGQAGWGAEGQLLGISPAFTPAPGCPDAAKVIIRTGQRYGFYIGDNAGAGGTSLKLEQDHGQWAGLGLDQRTLDAACGLTWNDFVAY